MVSGICPRAGGRIRAGGGTARSHHARISRRDRKKKRFVGQTGQEDKKKVRTESGRYISGSYKNNLYPAMGTAACWAGCCRSRAGPTYQGSIPCRGSSQGREHS